MLEGIVAWVLNNYVGEYFENLNAYQLSIALLQGQVELENIPLKKTALRKFDIPVQVRSGIIGRLTLTIPMHMRSEPWILKMSDVLVLLEPSTSKDDVEFIEQYEQFRKQAALDELEQYHKRKLLVAIAESVKLDNPGEQNQWWGASLVSAVTNNMQVILDNVHIRYEDVFRLTESHSGQAFNFGIRIESVTMQTTNSLWKPMFIQTDVKSQSNIFKKLNIKRLSFYWNCAATPTQLDEEASLFNLKKEMTPENTKHNVFILQPFCMEVRMEKNNSKFPLKKIPLIPRFKFDLRPEKIEVDFIKNQLAQIRYLAKEWARFDRKRQHRKWRPRLAVKSDPRAWWQFAANRVLDGNRRRQLWKDKHSVLTRVRHFNSYCKAYRRRLETYVDECSNYAQTSSSNCECIAIMRQIEQSAQFNYDELHLFREIVYRRYLHELEGSGVHGDDDEEVFEVISTAASTSTSGVVQASMTDVNPVSNEKPGGFYAWMSSWFSKDENNEEHQPEDDVNEAFFLDLRPQIEEKNLSPELKEVEKRMEEEIMDVLNETWDDSTILRRDTLLAELVFRLDKIVVRFMDSDDAGDENAKFTSFNRILSLNLRKVVSRVHLSPREHRTELSLSVEEMSVQRVQISPTMSANLSDETPTDLNLFTSAVDDEIFDSLLYGVSNMHTQLIFTIGRTKADEDLHKNDIFQTFHNDGRLVSQRSSMLKLFYKRLAPKLDIYHDLNIQLSPLFAMYDENALKGLINMFSINVAAFSNDFDPGSNNVTHTSIYSSPTNSKLFLTLTVPQVTVELRRRSAFIGCEQTSTDIPDSTSNPFALAKLSGLKLQISNLEMFVCKAKLFFQSIVVEDLFNRQAKTSWPLIRSVTTSSQKKSLHNMRSHSFSELRSDCATGWKSDINVIRSISTPDVPCLLVNETDQMLDYENLDVIGMKSVNFTIDDDTCKIVNISIVDSRHPQFATRYGQNHCKIVADFKNEMEIGMNRRSWIAILDFFGLMGDFSENNESSEQKYSSYQTGSSSYNVCCEMKAEIAKIAMNYPQDGSQLGVLSLDFCLFKMQVDTGNSDCPITLEISSSGLILSDLTPFYNELYEQRFIVKNKNTSNSNDICRGDKRARRAVYASNERIFFNIVKYRIADAELKRESDVELNLYVSEQYNASYVHTHRYFFAFLEFWTNFVSLQDRMYNFNKRSGDHLSGIDADESVPVQSTRCKLGVEFAGGLDLVVPLNQLCEEAIIFTTTKLTITNQFIRASSVRTFADKGIYHCGDVDDYDCLLDAMNVLCRNLRIFRGIRISNSFNKSKVVRKDSLRCASNACYFFCAEPSTNILSRLIDVQVDVFRNLSSSFSHSVPVFVVLTELVKVELSLSSQFYCLLRGILEQNIGEQYFKQPNTVPFELTLNINAEPTYEMGVTSKYATFCFRLSLNDAKMNFLTSVDVRTPGFARRDDGTGHESFARMGLQCAKMSFDSYIDGQYELYLICYSMELFDTRLGSIEGDVFRPPNVFTNVISSSTHGRNNKDNLMFEAHVLVKTDEAPIVTLVLMNSRVFLIFDWLMHAKDFILQTTTFVAPQENRSVRNYLYEVPKEGILVRTICSSVSPGSYYDTNCRRHQAKSFVNPNHSFTLKITLKEIDVVNVDDIKNANSSLLVALTTGVLTADDSAGVLQANFEIQKMNLFLSSISVGTREYCDPRIITNDFSATIALSHDLSQNSSCFAASTVLSSSASSHDKSHASTQSLGSPTNNIKNLECLMSRSQTGAYSQGSGTFMRFGASSGPIPSASNYLHHHAEDRGIHIIDKLHKRQKISVELSDKVETKFTFADFSTLQNIIAHSLERLVSESTSVYEEPTTSKCASYYEEPTSSISKICVKCAYLSASLMDDLQVSLPLLRFVMSNLFMEKCIDRLSASMLLGVDYFNEYNFGFEPLVELWNLEKLALQWRENHVNIDIQPSIRSTFNINLTQTFMQQLKRFVNRPRPSDTNRETSISLASTYAKKSSNLLSYNLTLHIPAGIGISVINKHNEELIYLQFRGVKMHLLKQQTTYQFSTHVEVVQGDNQLLNAERWQFLYCDPKLSTEDLSAKDEQSTKNSNAQHSFSVNNTVDKKQQYRRTKSSLSATSSISNESPLALNIEVNYTPTSHYDTFDVLRVRLCDLSILLDELLLWKLIEMITDLTDTKAAASTLKKTLTIVDDVDDSTSPPLSKNVKKTATTSEISKNVTNYFFDVLELEVGNVMLSALAVSDSSLAPELRALKRRFDITLVSFENALVSISTFKKNRYIGTSELILKAMGDFYLAELKKQKLSIIVTMDAFGNPMGLASDFKDSIEGLIFDGDVGGFVFGLGYGVTNSISKAASSWAQGVGFLTFDEQHEHMRRRMLRGQSQAENPTALSHLYGGVKGLGMGVFGGLTAIAKNTYVATQKDGVSGLIRGVTTGALDTVTKPLQGALDLLEGTASAFKEAVGSPSTRKQFADSRIRLPRVCTSLHSRLPSYSYELAEAQQMLLRINSYSTSELLFDVIAHYVETNARGDRIEYRAMICSEQCYILKQINQEPCTVAQRLVYEYLNNIQPTRISKSTPRGVVPLKISYITDKASPKGFDYLWCSSAEVATRLSRGIMNAKNYYDRAVQRRKTSMPDTRIRRGLTSTQSVTYKKAQLNTTSTELINASGGSASATQSQFARSFSFARPRMTPSASSSFLYSSVPPKMPNGDDKIDEESPNTSFSLDYR